MLGAAPLSNEKEATLSVREAFICKIEVSWIKRLDLGRQTFFFFSLTNCPHPHSGKSRRLILFFCAIFLFFVNCFQ